MPLELSKVFDHSSGLDFTARFFQVGSRMLDKGFMTYKNNKISIEDEKFDQEKNLTIRMSPINIHAGKLSTYKMILIDGFALRINTLKVAIPNFIPFLEDNGYFVIINAENKNVVEEEEEIVKLNNNLKKVEKVEICEVEGNKISLEVYHLRKN